MTDLPTLTTERLILRPFALSDASDVHRLAGDWAVADTTLNIPHPYEDGMAEDWISHHQDNFASGQQLTLAVTLRASGALVGAIGLRLTPRFARAEMGYWIGKPYWGHGYCTEAAQAVIACGFGELGLHKIFASHLVRNPASGRVMQKAGMTYEGTLREHVQKWGAFEDLKMYGILRREYSAN
jgi:RimJ/RimL family protein N-acetyltransferase